jgi:hypothetical protein
MTILVLKLCYRAIVIKKHGIGTQKRHVDQWHRIEDPEIILHNCSQLILDNYAKTYIGENIACSTNGARKIVYPDVKARPLSLIMYKTQLKVAQKP